MMFQKEVANRITAKPGSKSYSRLSVITQLKTKTKILFDIPDTAFFPKPKVRSSLVQFIPYENKKLLKPLAWTKKINNYKATLEGIEFDNLSFEQYKILTKYSDD